LQVYETFEDDDNIYIVMEYCRGGRLFSEQKPSYLESQIAMIVGQLLSAVRYLHDHQMLHGELIVENILLEDSIRVLDFGQSRFFHEEPSHATSGLAAPEIKHTHYGAAADMWSLGIIAYTLLTGRAPDLVKGNVDLIWERNVSEDAKDFVRSLLRIHPAGRLDSHAAQRHPWIRSLAYKVIDKNVSKRDVVTVCRHWRDLHQKESKFKRAALTVLARHYPPPADELSRKYSSVFSYMDKHKSGVITFKELQRVLLKQRGFGDNDREMESMFRAVDVNGDTVIAYSEFMGATLEAKMGHAIPEHAIQRAFAQLDQDETGFITAFNFVPLLGLTESECNMMMREVCQYVDKSGMISYQGFLHIVQERPRAEIAFPYGELCGPKRLVRQSSNNSIVSTNSSVFGDSVCTINSTARGKTVQRDSQKNSSSNNHDRSKRSVLKSFSGNGTLS
jgi:calcium-dependent protein kinase